MRKSILAAAALMLATTASAWAQTTNVDGSPKTNQPSTAAMQRHALDTWEDIQHYSAAQKNQAVAEAREGMRKLNERIDRSQHDLDRHWYDMSQDARLKKEKALKHLKDARVNLQRRFDQLKMATNSNWDATKARFGVAWKSTRQAWQDLIASSTKPERRPVNRP